MQRKCRLEPKDGIFGGRLLLSERRGDLHNLMLPAQNILIYVFSEVNDELFGANK